MQGCPFIRDMTFHMSCLFIINYYLLVIYIYYIYLQEFSRNLLKLEQVEWYADIIFYLKNLTCPSHLVGHKKRALRLKSSKYVLTRDGLGWRNPDGIILRCVDEIEAKKLVDEFHTGFCGGHYAAKTTTH
jgi:hypothetical protein